MSAVQPFFFDGRQVRVRTDDEGAPWFVVKDVCAVLGLTNVTEAARSLDDDERGSEILNTPGGPQQMATVSESGLYALIFTSRKAEAKAFRKWVTGTVLPALRREGRYALPGATTGAVPALPDAARRLRPALRERVLADALQAARLDNAGSDAVLAYFNLFCQLGGGLDPASAWPGAPPQRMAEWEAVNAFVAEDCQEAPGHALRAGTLYRAFERWWHRRRQEGPMPSQHVFGQALARHFTKRKTGGQIRYHDVRLVA